MAKRSLHKKNKKRVCTILQILKKGNIEYNELPNLLVMFFFRGMIQGNWKLYRGRLYTQLLWNLYKTD